uniref:Uncharacterized protein n=1 Tax=Eucampia antarctica TaxID=49252 RepID=A0A6U0QCT9_9STRA|mmetsp:Transcript_15747/g.15137  ORF Transcript_15747/g.15137 Transcript_15747/m.15137 type:complete len:401 (+) Transcript_15747:317-1519(+)
MMSQEYYPSSQVDLQQLKEDLLVLQKVTESIANERDALKIKLMVQREITGLEEKKKKAFEQENKALHVQVQTLKDENQILSRKSQVYEKEQIEPQASTRSCASSPSVERTDNQIPISQEDSVCSSLDSEQKAIRLHAQKMLLWANKAIDKKGYTSSNSSLGSRSTILNQDVRNRLPRFPSKSKTLKTASSTICSNRNRSISSKSRSRAGGSSILDKSQSTHKETIVCTCSKKMFPSNTDEAEFFLPKIETCKCGKENKEMDFHRASCDGSISLDLILRPWQAEFLKCLAITTSKELNKATKEKAQAIARTMKIWCKKKRKKSVRTKSCLIALYIWSRTAEQTNKKMKQQRIIGIEQVRRPNILDLTFSIGEHSSDGSISTMGCNSMVDKPDVTMDIKYMV